MAGPAPLAAQPGPAVEVRGGASLPVLAFTVGPATGSERGPGPSFAVQFTFPTGPRRVAYVGFAQHRLACGSGCQDAGALVSTGWNVGARMGLLAGGTFPWLRLGVLFDKVEADFLEDGAPVARVSDLSFGGEVGVGGTIHLGGRLSLSPGVRYALSNARFPRAGVMRMRYLVMDVGLIAEF